MSLTSLSYLCRFDGDRSADVDDSDGNVGYDDADGSEMVLMVLMVVERSLPFPFFRMLPCLLQVVHQLVCSVIIYFVSSDRSSYNDDALV